MNEEEKKAVFYLKDLENDKEHLVIEQRQAITTILNLIDKQQKQIKILKDNLVEERGFCKSILETLKNCVDKDYLHKMISFKDGEIEKLKGAYQILKDDIEEHNIAYVDTPEFEENYISKDKIREKIKELEKEIEEVNENCPDFTIIYEHEVDIYGIINVLKELLVSGQESDQEGGQEDE